MKISDITVVIPSQDRPERLLRAVESVLSTARGVEVVLVLDEQDDESRAIVEPLEHHLVIETVRGDLHTAERWNAGAAIASGDYFVVGADDIIFQDGWLEAALEAIRMIGASGLVGFNEGEGSSFGSLATHYMISRKYAVRGMGGCMMPPVYEHGHTDVEATLRAKRDGRLVFAERARIEHLHPFYGTAESDAIYEKADSSRRRDRRLFKRRLKLGFPDDFEPVVEFIPDRGWGSVAVGIRLYKNVEAEFLPGWSHFLMNGLRPGDKLLDMAAPIGKPHHVAANIIAADFLKTDCDSLLFVDDDMIIPWDALSKMRDNEDNHGFDVVQGFCTHKSYPPHAVALQLADDQPGEPDSFAGQKYNALAHVPDNSVAPVDAVGIAFTLVKRQVFEHMLSEEHGAEWTVWFDMGGHSEMEDMRFSSRCREAGFNMAVDTHAKIGHIGKHVYGWPEHQQFVRLLEKNNG